MRILTRFVAVAFLLVLAACTAAGGPEAAVETGQPAGEPTAAPLPTDSPPPTAPPLPTDPPAPTNTPPPTDVPPPTGEPAPATTQPAADEKLDAFLAELQMALISQDYDTLARLMADPIGSGPWRAEWSQFTPEELVAAFRNGTLAAYGVQFSQLDEAAIGDLLGQPPATLLGPDASYVTAVHSTGWGQSLDDEAILFISEVDGQYRWSALLYTTGRFADSFLPVVPPPAGLLYSVFDTGVFAVQQDGTSEQLLDAATAATPNLRLSPDGRHAAYLTEDRQLWRIDIATGEQQQLAADLNLSNFLMWASADTLFTGVWFTPDESDGPNFGHLTTIYRDEAPQIIDEESLLGNLPALSPDAQTIAFDGVPSGASDTLTGRLYTPEGGVEVFDPAAFRSVGRMIDGPVFNPSWSPDGRRLTWLATTGERVGLQLYNYDTGLAGQLFDWDPARFGGTIPAPVWSPDGQWLALTVLANGPEGSGLYLIAADGSEVRLVDARGSSPVWVSETELVFGAVGLARLYDLTTGEQALLDLMPGSWPQGAVRAGE